MNEYYYTNTMCTFDKKNQTWTYYIKNNTIFCLNSYNFFICPNQFSSRSKSNVLFLFLVRPNVCVLLLPNKNCNYTPRLLITARHIVSEMALLKNSLKIFG